MEGGCQEGVVEQVSFSFGARVEEDFGCGVYAIMVSRRNVLKRTVVIRL